MMCVISDLDGGEYDFVIYSAQIQWASLELTNQKHLVTRTYMALLQTPPSRLKTQGQSLSPQPGAEPWQQIMRGGVRVHQASVHRSWGVEPLCRF